MELSAAGIDTLLLSLDGALRYIPFAALHDGNGYLIERFAIGLLTEGSKVQLAAAAPGSALRVGGLGMTKGSTKFNMRPLPAAKNELYRIVSEGSRKGLIPGVTFIDDAFTETRLQELVDRQYSILHVASHFRSQAGNERDSFLLLGNERTLTLEQIRRMDLSLDSVDLMTLSACETAISEGRNANGAEIEGLGVILLNQGARNVLATLWQVADEGTAELMVDFYRRRTESPELPKTGVLRAAQLALMQGTASASRRERGPDYSHPYFWGPFVLMGAGL
jgi:CHAT domain-containing protein